MCPISPRSARQQFATIELLLRMAVVCDRIDLHTKCTLAPPLSQQRSAEISAKLSQGRETCSSRRRRRRYGRHVRPSESERTSHVKLRDDI
jgi:hypothetical protein